MELVANNQHRLKDIAEEVGSIVAREEKDMWELGSLLCEARAICDDPALSVLEGIEGKTGNHRFSWWLSNERDLSALPKEKRTRSMNLHRVFGRRREEVKHWKTSALYELATDKNSDVRSQILREFPGGVKVLDMRERMNAIRTPANTGATTTTESTTTQTTTTTQQTEASPHLPDASWEDLLSAVNITTETVEQASQDMMHPQYMVARRLSESKERIVKAMTPLSKPERKKALNAVVDVLAYEQEVFEAEVKALMPKYNKELETRLKREIEEQKKVTAGLRRKVGAGFDKKDFKIIRGVLHSDRPQTQAQRDKAFNLFLKLEPLFLDKLRRKQ